MLRHLYEKEPICYCESMKKSLSLIALLAFASLAGCSSATKSITTNTDAVISSETSSDTFALNTYKNPTYNYQIQYPSDWKIDISQDPGDPYGDLVFVPYEITSGGPNNPDRREWLGITINKNKNLNAMRSEIESVSDNCALPTSIKLNYETATTYICSHNNPTVTSFNYLIQKGKNIWRIYYLRHPDSEQKYEPYLQEMIQSIQFFKE
ncbi:MAG: hypothetical protein JWM56_394 [Candidatus Peribacteria bacterium]|nr:hypothetical protein [Candidatus Peribacteria bacterium]